MDFIDQIRTFAERIPQQIPHILTEEATKNAFIMPFINMLGYNVFDPTEVVPEFTADHGTKKGEKVDYAILRDGKPAILIECKHVGANLDQVHASQLFRYFTVTPAKLAILTNGVVYRFFTDLDEANKMDERPFLEFSLLDIKEPIVEEIKRFTRSRFEPDALSDSAAELKYTNGIKALLADELASPSDELVRLFTARVYGGRFTQSVKDRFTPLVRKAFRGFVNDRINDRLQSALSVDEQGPGHASAVDTLQEAEPETDTGKDGIVTTAEEMEGVSIVRAIVAEVIDPERVVMRDTKSYCGVLIDDNNRKPVCRLHFNAATIKRLGLFDAKKNEEKVEIETLRDIYKYADRLKETARRYVEQTEPA